jgi:hypothetical protein
MGLTRHGQPWGAQCDNPNEAARHADHFMSWIQVLFAS